MFAEPNNIHPVGNFCSQALSGEAHGMSFVDTCVIAAGSGPTKNTLDVVREGAGWRFFSREGFPLEIVSFSKPKLFVGTHGPHATKMVFLVTVAERGKKTNKERREKILHYPRTRSTSANYIYMRCWSPVPVVISLQREITDRMPWCLLSI